MYTDPSPYSIPLATMAASWNHYHNCQWRTFKGCIRRSHYCPSEVSQVTLVKNFHLNSALLGLYNIHTRISPSLFPYSRNMHGPPSRKQECHRTPVLLTSSLVTISLNSLFTRVTCIDAISCLAHAFFIDHVLHVPSLTRMHIVQRAGKGLREDDLARFIYTVNAFRTTATFFLISVHKMNVLIQSDTK